MRALSLLALLLLVGAACATVYFKEDFGEVWEKRWTPSKAKEKDNAQGKFTWTETEWPLIPGDKGIFTSEDNRFYQISAGFPKFSNKGKTLYIQYVLKFTQKIDCGGGYLKFGPSPAPGAEFHGETPYNIMFGPDFCGPSTKKVHVIVTYKGKNHLIKKAISPKEDQLSHVYTLVLKPDQTYQVLIDDVEAAAGSLTDDWDLLPPKEIKDPAQSKPADWVDEAEMDDPADKKPAGWDDVPRQLPDPAAKKPDDWDDALDGEWEPPVIDNPDWKGEWKPKRIPNPAYKGAWVHPLIANPDYKEDKEMYAFADFGWAGIDVWQVKSGTLFDSLLITDDADTAAAHRKSHWADHKDAEKQRFDDVEAAKKKASDAAAPAPADADPTADDVDSDAKDEL
jgi:calreticulin